MVILTLDHPYDQAMQARATNKMIGQIAGQGKIELTEEMRAAFQAKEEQPDIMATDDHPEHDLPELDDKTNRMISQQCEEHTVGTAGDVHEYAVRTGVMQVDGGATHGDTGDKNLRGVEEVVECGARGGACQDGPSS